jgi:uncharacterized lipoprotein YajG
MLQLRNGSSPFLNCITEYCITRKREIIMKKDLLCSLPFICILTIILAGCGTAPTTTPTSAPMETLTEEAIPTDISNTPDPCSPGQIETIVQRVHSHMREFDDASSLAAALTQAQLGDAIARQRMNRSLLV